MIERFEGENGKRLLEQALGDQTIVSKNTTVLGGIIDVVHLQELDSGDVLIAQGAEDNDIYFVISGSLAIEVNGRRVATREAGTHVGEMSLIDPKGCRSATAFALEKTLVAKVSEPDFSATAEDCAELWRRIAVELCDRLRNRNRMIRPPNEFPNVFVCSSSENLTYAEGIQLGLDHHKSSVSVWTDQVFGPTQHTMEDLQRELDHADFGIAVVMDEDEVHSRKQQHLAPRDNVVFELGLFMGKVGRERTIIVSPRSVDLKMPSDLLGLKPLTFALPDDPEDTRKLATALGPVCTQIKALISKLGPR